MKVLKRLRKTLGVTDNSGNNAEFDETNEQDVRGVKVTMKGKDGKVYLAVRNQNNFAYTISISDLGKGADIDEMIEYIKATR